MKKTVLQQLVKDSGLNQVKFAKAVGVDIHTLRKQLQVNTTNTLGQAYKYAKILNITELKGYYENNYVEIYI